MNETFCILPWVQLIVRADGSAQVCNRMIGELHEGRRRVSIGTETLDQAWNCSDARTMRKTMADGGRLSCCRECYDLEDAGAQSLRQEMLQKWRQGFLNPEGLDDERVRAASVERAHRLPDSPRWIQLDLGNMCNLACRMCNSGASNRIRLDPVHGRWSGPARDTARDPGTWFRDPDVVADVLRAAGAVRQLHVIGGEPMLIRELQPILRTLVDTGAAADVELSLHTNATRRVAPWFDLLERFQRVVMYLSVDGAGADYEYIRHPGRWETFTANAAALQELPNTQVRAHVVVQAYNVTRITTLFEYLDCAGIPFEPHLLTAPPYLRASILPQTARSVASARLLSYAGRRAGSAVGEKIRGMARYLDWAPAALPAEVDTFVRFTNDLDASRGQRLATANPELAELLRAGGWAWSDELRYARP